MNSFFNIERYDEVTNHHSFNDFLDKIYINGVHQIFEDENPYHIYINDIDLNSNYILIGFSGMLPRSKNTPPFFSFRKVAKKIGVGLISISDPSLNLGDNISLSWYVGNYINGNIPKKIANLLDNIITKTKKKLILCGGSGGGYAALNIHAHMKNKNKVKSFVWNPQTDITKYNDKVLQNYFSKCIKPDSKLNIYEIRKFFIENGIAYKIDKDESLEQLIFINGYDHSHLRKQVRSFFSFSEKSMSKIYVGNWGKGHTPPNIDDIIFVLLNMINDLSLADIINSIHGMNTINKPILSFDRNKKYLDNIICARASVIKFNNNRVLCVKCNIFEHFIGYQIKISILSENYEKIFESKYLLGANVAEVYFEIRRIDIIKLKKGLIEFYIEDYVGNSDRYMFNFHDVMEIHNGIPLILKNI